MKLFDTRTRQYETLPAKPAYTMYVCGITPYDSAHLGHIFTFITYDLLLRRLEDGGAKVRMVRNITDVDEPIFMRARENGEPYMTLAEREIGEFRDVMKRLDMRPADAEPRVSEYIAAIADAAVQLLEQGAAYRLENDIYFDVSTASGWGRLGGYDDTLMRRLMADRGGDPDREGKRSPFDFLLWRGVDDNADPAAWDTPLGRGRPGWHLECSVMGRKTLGDTIDIHGGGTDLIFPHHEAEAAQNAGLGRAGLVAHWMHVAPMALGGDKMSKSLGNLVFARDLLGQAPAAAVRLALMNYHHRIGGEWLPDLLMRSQQLVSSWPELKRGGADSGELITEVRAALDDDLDTPRVVQALEAAGSSAPDLGATRRLLGLG